MALFEANPGAQPGGAAFSALGGDTRMR